MPREDFGWDPNMDGPVAGAPQGPMTAQQASNLLQDHIDKLDDMRREMAHAYGLVPAKDVLMEHEVGESLTAVRKAIKRYREALGKVSQLKLPMND